MVKDSYFASISQGLQLLVHSTNCASCSKPMNKRKNPLWSMDIFGFMGKYCKSSKSIEVHSWFTISRLNIGQILALTSEVLSQIFADNLKSEHKFISNIVGKWRKFIKNLMVDQLQIYSEKLCGDGKFVKVGESLFGKLKICYHNYQMKYNYMSKFVVSKCIYITGNRVECICCRVFCLAIFIVSQLQISLFFPHIYVVI